MRNRNIVTLLATALSLACFLLLPQMRAASGEGASLPDTFSGSNTFDGFHALFSQTSNSFNSAFGWQSLASQTTATAVTGCGAGTLLSNTADNNTAVGAGALLFNTTATGNVAVGGFSLLQNVTGGANTAVGMQALQENHGGVTNTGVGRFAAQNNTAGFNTAVGGFALQANTSGARNTAVGAGAMENADGGDDNTAIGELAGLHYTGTESNNICIGSGTQGTAGESNAIRIGNASTSGGINVINTSALANAITIGSSMSTQGITILTLLGFGGVSIANGLQTMAGASTCNIGGIYNQAYGPADMAVRIGSDNRLGTVVSSRRFKHDIKPMDNASEAILALKPVTFQYNSDTTNTPRIGLIAEDVAEVSKQLVIPDKEGKPLSVRYEDVNVMLLNEFIKEHKKVEDQQATISELKNEVQTVVAQLKEQAAQIQKVSAQLEVSKPAPQVVTNKP